MPSAQFETTAKVSVKFRKGLGPRNNNADDADDAATTIYGNRGGSRGGTPTANSDTPDKIGVKNLKTALAVQRLATK